ncbi:hypothetical protein D3C71_1196930 [compost metagenome]
MQLAVPGGQFGRGQRDDLVDLGDFGVGIGVAREDFPDFFVAIGAFEVFLLAEVVQSIFWLRVTEAFFQSAGSTVVTSYNSHLENLKRFLVLSFVLKVDT